MNQYIRVFGDSGSIRGAIEIQRNFCEGSNDMAEAMMKLILKFLTILILPLIGVFSP